MALRWLADAVGVREGEGGRTARLFLLILVVTFAVALAKAAQQGIFLAASGRDRIAEAFFVSALTLASVSFLVSALAARLGPVRMFLLLLGVIGSLLAGLWAAVRWVDGLDPIIIYVVVEASVGLLVVQAWSVVTEALDMRSAKRLLPLIGNAAGAGWMIGGFGVRPLAHLLGAPVLMVISAGFLLSAAVLTLVILRLDLGGRAARGSRGTTLWAGARAGMSYVIGQPLLRALALLTVIGLLMEELLDYQLFASAQVTLVTDDRIAGFMGTFFGVTGAISLVAPLVSGRILARFGSASAAPSGAALVVLCSLLFIISPVFAVVVAARGVYRVLDNAIGSPARSHMQTAIPPVRRSQAGALLKGVLAPLFYAGCAVGLRLMPQGTDLRWLSGATALLATGSVATAWWYLRPAYLEALRSSLAQQRLELDVERPGIDGEHVRLLAAEARGGDVDQARFAVSLLAEMGAEARPALRDACEHPAAEVVVDALDALARVGTAEDAAVAARLLAGPAGDGVHEAAARAIVRLGLEPAGGELRAHTDDPDARVRALARAAVVAFDPVPPGDGDGGGLAAMLTSAEVAERAAAATAGGLTRLRSPAVAAPFAALLADRQAQVRGEALRAAGQLGDPGLVPAMVAAIGDREVAEAAVAALAALDDQLIPEVERALDGATDETWSRVASALAAGAGPRGDQLLAGMLESDQRVTRYRAARAIAARRRGGPWRPPPRTAVAAAIASELRIGYGYYLLLAGIARNDGVADLEIEPTFQFLAGEVEMRIRQTHRRLLGLLALVAEPALIRLAENQLLGGDARRAAAALELLENVLDRKLREDVVPFFDRRSLRLRLRDVQGRRSLPHSLLDDPLDGIMNSGDEYLQRCALIGYGDEMARRYPEKHRTFAESLPLMQKVAFLRGVALFHELSGEDLIQLAGIAESVALPAGKVIFHKGDPSDDIYLVVSGTVAIRDGDTEIASVPAPEPFGELAALDGEERSASAVARDDVELLRISAADLDELIERRPHVGREIIRVLARRVRIATRRFVGE